LADRAAALQDWHQTAVLTVESTRLRRWYRPGVLVVGDAAHVMSPVGGVGINVAIQDAVAVSNMLGPTLRHGPVPTRDLGAVQARREWPTRIIQRVQDVMMRQLLAASEISATGTARLPLGLQLAQRVPLILTLRDRLLVNGGFRPERIRRIRTTAHHPSVIN
jgi:2-polyprenyl-6-methoxyphenol hydroxylase-like FAD-dependent oxidoreductase